MSGDGRTALLFGGRDGTTVFGDLWSYDLGSNAWTELSPAAGPDARFGHEAVWVEGIGLVVFAGQAGTTFFNDLWAYDPAADAWPSFPAVAMCRSPDTGRAAPSAPTAASGSATGSRPTACGSPTLGRMTSTPAPGPMRLRTAPRPIERCLHGCWWTDDGALALYAGQTTGTLALDDFWTLADGAWSEAAGGLPPARNLYARARIDGATLVFGGQALDMSYLDDLWLFPDAAGDAVELEPATEGPSAAPARPSSPTPARTESSSLAGGTRMVASATCGR